MENLTAMRNGVVVYVGPGCEYETGMISAELRSEHVRQVLNRLAAYEKTGLGPEEIYTLCSMDRRARMADLLRLESYQSLGTFEELAALVNRPVPELTRAMMATEYLSICDEHDCAGDQSVGVQPCPFYERADVDDSGKTFPTRCKLKAMLKEEES